MASIDLTDPQALDSAADVFDRLVAISDLYALDEIAAANRVASAVLRAEAERLRAPEPDISGVAAEILREVARKCFVGPSLPEDYEFEFTIKITAGEMRALAAGAARPAEPDDTKPAIVKAP